jgi:hypothetical protein
VAADLFDFVAEQLEHHTSLDRLEARGTLRLALKEAGLDPQSIALTSSRGAASQIPPRPATP